MLLKNIETTPPPQSNCEFIRTPIFSAKFMSRSWWNDFWAREPDRFGPPSQNFLEIVFSNMKQNAGGKAVDVGSGNGRYAMPLSQSGFRTDAIEWAECGLAEMRKLCQTRGVSVTAIEQDFTQMNIIPSQYDLVLSSGFLEEVPADMLYETVTRHIDLAKEGGTIALKYCLEIEGRGKLVDTKVVRSAVHSKMAVEIKYVEDAELKLSKSGMKIRTATLIARKYAQVEMGNFHIPRRLN